MIDRRLFTSELIKSQEIGELTDKAESLCRILIGNVIEKYGFHPNKTDIYREKALDACIKHSLSFKKELLKDGFPYVVQIIRCSLAGTYKNLITQNKKK